MAVRLQSPAAAARRYGLRRRYQPMSEINVTPLVDVMLVLLVVFMVTAPLLTVGVPVDLPQDAGAGRSTSRRSRWSSPSRQDGKIFLQETAIDARAAGAAPAGDHRQQAGHHRSIVRGDKAINYGRVMRGDGHWSPPPASPRWR